MIVDKERKNGKIKRRKEKEITRKVFFTNQTRRLGLLLVVVVVGVDTVAGSADSAGSAGGSLLLLVTVDTGAAVVGLSRGVAGRRRGGASDARDAAAKEVGSAVAAHDAAAAADLVMISAVDVGCLTQGEVGVSSNVHALDGSLDLAKLDGLFAKKK